MGSRPKGAKPCQKSRRSRRPSPGACCGRAAIASGSSTINSLQRALISSSRRPRRGRGVAEYGFGVAFRCSRAISSCATPWTKRTISRSVRREGWCGCSASAGTGSKASPIRRSPPFGSSSAPSFRSFPIPISGKGSGCASPTGRWPTWRVSWCGEIPRRVSWWCRSSSFSAVSPSILIARCWQQHRHTTTMCGIVGYVGYRDAVSFILPGLRRLEYRGYDSAGIATVSEGSLDVRKTTGKIADLETLLAADRPNGVLGVGHTRWATHGRPSDTNAHPHVDCQSQLAIVHNGIIENYRELRKTLAADGHRFRSQTDTEVVAHQIERYQGEGLDAAVLRAAKNLQGSFAIACVAADAPNTLVVFRRGSSPLVVGFGRGEMFVASDIPALQGRTRDILVLDDGELAVLTPDSIAVRTLAGAPVRRSPRTIDWDVEAAEKSGYPHFMLKEIFEQPEALQNTIRERVDAEGPDIRIPELGLKDRELAGLNRLCFVACGTSWHAALVGKYLVEALSRLPVEVDVASEFRYRKPVVDGRVLTVPISQSGETADTLAALREAKDHGSRAVAICNVVGSSLAREADGVVYTRAGIEIGVASTKAFTAQLAAVTLLALKLGLARGFADPALARQVVKGLAELPDLLSVVLRQSDAIRKIAERFVDRNHFLYLGRGLDFPLALEGALKLKEISYIHAEGYPAGEMKHGPIALVDSRMPVVVIAPRGSTYEKITSNLEEVKARDGIVIAVATEGDEEIAATADLVIPIPPSLEWLQPLLVAVPLQLLAYHVAVLRGCDVDQPRNLAKSVTVE